MSGQGFDILTVLFSNDSKSATKRFRINNGRLEKMGMGMSTFFNVIEQPVSSLPDLSSALTALEDDEQSFVIRGELIEGRQRENIRRTGKSSLWNDANSNFNPASRQWCMIDIDDLDLPDELSDISSNTNEIIAFTTSKLPDAFQHVNCHYQFSASMGIKTDKVRVHLWYWLDRKVSDAEMKAWLAQSTVTVDLSLYRPVQPHFTAKPIFEGDAIDPLPVRSGIFRAGKNIETVTVPDSDHLIAVANTASSRRTFVRRDGYIEPQEIIRDPDTGLAVDGRERLLYFLSLQIMKEWVTGNNKNEQPDIDELTSVLWERFNSEADLNDNKWSEVDCKNKLKSRISELQSGTYRFSSHSNTTTLYPDIEPYFYLETVNKNEGEQQLEEALCEFFNAVENGRISRLALRVTMGAGKTRQTINHLKSYLQNSFATNVEIYVPRHDIADEYEERLKSDDAQARIIHMYGRGGISQQIPPLCERYDYVRQLEGAGISIYPNACFASRDDICSHFSTCDYLHQYRAGDELEQLQNTVRIFQHASLPLPRNRIETLPDIVIVDEAFLSVCLKKSTIEPELIRRYFNHPDYQNLGNIIIDSLRDGKPLLEQLRMLGINRQIISDINLDELRPDIAFEGQLSQQRPIRSSHDYHQLNKLKSIMIEELSLGNQDDITRVIYDSHRSKITITYLDNTRIPDTAALLILDATADEQLLNRVVGDIEVKRIDIQQNASITQVYDRTGSNQFWDGNTQDVENLISVMNEWSSCGEKVLCIGHKRLADRLREDPSLYDAVQINHFGNVRGSNAAEDCTVIFITGRNEPSPADVDINARALFWDDDMPLTVDEGSRIDTQEHQNTRLPIAFRGYCFRDKSKKQGVGVHSFSDERTERLHLQIREAETVQAIARLRLVHNQHMKRVFLLSNIPVEIPIDNAVGFNELMPDRLEIELLEKRNLPLTQLGWQVMRPDIVSTAKMAERMLANSKFNRPSELTLAKIGQVLPDLRRATMCILTFRAKHNGRTREHRHLFMLSDLTVEQDMSLTTGALPIDEWTQYLEQGDAQIDGSGWGAIEVQGIEYVPASLLPQ